MSRAPPQRHWRSYGNDPLPTGAEALDEPFAAFPSWFMGAHRGMQAFAGRGERTADTRPTRPGRPGRRGRIRTPSSAMYLAALCQ